MATMFSKQNFGFFMFICTHKTENNMTDQTSNLIPTRRDWAWSSSGSTALNTWRLLTNHKVMQ